MKHRLLGNGVTVALQLLANLQAARLSRDPERIAAADAALEAYDWAHGYLRGISPAPVPGPYETQSGHPRVHYREQYERGRRSV